jgi:hypothetical protein
MRLSQLFEFSPPSAEDIKNIDQSLNQDVYQPADQLRKGKPVIDLEIPTDTHFMDRIIQRSDKARITKGEIYNLLKAAKQDPRLGLSREIQDLSVEDDPNKDIVARSPNNLIIPLIARPNTDCVKEKPGTAVGWDRRGNLVPKNKLTAKTIYRKGIPD